MSETKNNLWRWLGIGICCFLVGLGVGACGEDNGGGGPSPSPDCEEDADCDDGEVCDTEAEECVGCLDESDCDDGLCDVEANECVECFDEGDCPDHDFCDSGYCVDCLDDGDCDEDDGEFCDNGVCVDEGDLCADVECGDHQYCDDDTGECVDIPADPGYSCHEPEDLGELSDDDTLSIQADPSEQPSTMDTNCSDEDFEPGNAVFEFTVDEPMDVEITLGEGDWHTGYQKVVEVREGDCADPDAELERAACDNIYENDPVLVDAEPDTIYYVIIEALHDHVTESFELDVEAEALECAPKGGWRCDDEEEQTIWQCEFGEHEVPETCGVACEGNECLGDGCHNALEVSGSMTVEGTTRPYTNTFDFLPYPECSSDPLGDEGPISDGRDMVFYLPDLEVGQTVIADGSETAQTNYFGIVEDCDADNFLCIHGESHDQVMEWDVADDGDYYLIFNRDSGNAGDFLYMVDIVE